MNKTNRIILLLLAIIIFSAVISPVAYAADNGPVAETQYGMIRGKYNGDTMCFLGVPYAKATTGILRFTPPVAPDKWDGVMDTTVQPEDSVSVCHSFAPFRKCTETITA